MIKHQLNEQELEVVRKCKEWGFGAYLQGAWFQYPGLVRKIEEGNYPSQNELIKLNQKMEQRRLSFDDIYLDLLPREELNPLEIEQQAWKLLSPFIRQHTDIFSKFLETYYSNGTQREQILTPINNWWNLLQDWNILSNSYKAKLEKMWDEVESREQQIRDLTKRLSEKR
jgi:hypothetical protein